MKEDRNYKRAQALVNLDAICGNITRVKEILHPRTKIMAVIKADAYGHGAIPVAEALDSLVDAYAVAIVEEGAALRRAGIIKPILLLGYTAKEQMEEAIRYHLTQTIFEYHTAELLSKKAVEIEKTAKIHIKLDTGMGRIGFLYCNEHKNDILRLAALPGLDIEGLFTHFAKADEADKASVKKQYSLFLDYAKELEDAGLSFRVKHVSNSAAMIDLPEMNLDMVRCGIATYGLYPSDEVDKERVFLEPAMELKSHVAYVKTLGAGCGVSYGSDYFTTQDTIVATIPMGYGDGYSRRLSAKGYVLIHGKKAPILGRICMDQFMVDVTGIPETKQGDQVTLFGRDGGEQLPIEDLARLIDTIHYEMICDIGKRVPRVYLKKEQTRK